jgi:hypothetical protein
MRKILLILVLIYFAAYPFTAGAQALPEQPQPGPVAATPEQEARNLETELVRMVRSLLEKNSHRGASGRPEKIKKVQKAQLPEPLTQDTRILRDQLTGWKEKSLLMADTLKQRKALKLTNKHEQQSKKLIEKLQKRERVVVNPKRRPGGEKEEEAFEKMVHRELDRLEDRQESELRKIEREAKREKKLIEQLAKDLQKALSGKHRNR